jgi:adenylylsulfate kinase
MTKNITWHKGHIEREDRTRLLGKNNKVAWFTGLSGSGKSTIAVAAEKVLHEKGYPTYILDGDNIRHGLTKDLGFSKEDRQENLRRIAEVAKLFYDAGLTVLVSFISPFEREREFARKLIGKDFFDVYIKCPIAVCESRDPKGLYKKVRKGELTGFTGIDAPYDVPVNPELTIDTENQSVEESARQLATFIEHMAD